MSQRALLFALPLASAIAAALGGCVDASVQEVRMSATGISAHEAVVLLGRRQNVSYETEEDFVSCVGKALASDAIRVIPEQDFVNALFPWFEPRVAPMDAKQLPRLLSLPVLARKLKDDGVRYIVWIDGQTENDRSGSFTCSVTPGGAGCFGFVTDDKDSTYEAQVWDLQNMRTAGKITSQANGTDYYPMVVLPIPIVAPVQGTACSGLADNLRTFLTGSNDTARTVAPVPPASG